jgi:hypothetical protein
MCLAGIRYRVALRLEDIVRRLVCMRSAKRAFRWASLTFHSDLQVLREGFSTI